MKSASDMQALTCDVIEKIEGRDVNIERPRKNPPYSTAVQSRVNERASSNCKSFLLYSEELSSASAEVQAEM
jgi:hypothetical protein